MLSVEFTEDVDVLEALRGLRLFTVAESLGGFESLVCVPAAMTHAAMTPEARAAAGISDRLVRLSIGLEDAGDLIADLFGALDQAAAAARSRARAGGGGMMVRRRIVRRTPKTVGRDTAPATMGY